MTVETGLAVLAVVLVVVGGRARAGNLPVRPGLEADGVGGDGTAARRAQRAAGPLIEVAALVCLGAAAVLTTLRHRDDLDVDHMAGTLLALVVVAALLAVAGRRARTAGQRRSPTSDAADPEEKR